jgi:NAD(P)-dependent dehydrogenase (short-subunit alcohol dehydrogenase family)
MTSTVFDAAQPCASFLARRQDWQLSCRCKFHRLFAPCFTRLKSVPAANLDRTLVPDYQALLRLEGRAFVVLGGGNGIGRQVCHALTQAGARVACVDRDPALANHVAQEVGGYALTGDITKRADVERIFSDAHKALGPVTGLVDIVGMPHLGPLAGLDDVKWASQFDLVLNHAFLAMQIGGKAIADAGGGSMVFVASMAGLVSIPGQSAYGAAKAALIHLVAGMGKELGPAHVRVNAVAPGFVRTPRLNTMLNEDQWRQLAERIPIGGPAQPSEIAAAILFLSSGLASHVTGQTLAVDGGIAGLVQLPKLWP